MTQLDWLVVGVWLAVGLLVSLSIQFRVLHQRLDLTTQMIKTLSLQNAELAKQNLLLAEKIDLSHFEARLKGFQK
jgi:hypothetical protein